MNEDHGPLFSGSERDMYQLAFEHVTALARGSEVEAHSTPMSCENCGDRSGTLEECPTCLFFWCAGCIGTADHTESHRIGSRNEVRQ